MTLQYIRNPKIITHTTKALIKELMSSGVPNEWVIVCTSTTKTAEEKLKFQEKASGQRIYYSRYPELEWATHEGENNYSIIVRKVQTQ